MKCMNTFKRCYLLYGADLFEDSFQKEQWYDLNSTLQFLTRKVGWRVTPPSFFTMPLLQSVYRSSLLLYNYYSSSFRVLTKEQVHSTLYNLN